MRNNQLIIAALKPFRDAGWTWREIEAAIGLHAADASHFFHGDKIAGEKATARYLYLIADYKLKHGIQVDTMPPRPSHTLSGVKKGICLNEKLDNHPARFNSKKPITQCYWDMVDAAGMKTCHDIVKRTNTTKHHVAKLLQGVVLIKRDGLIKQGQAMGLSLCQIAKIMRKNKLNAWADYIAERWLTGNEIRAVKCPWVGANFSNEIYK